MYHNNIIALCRHCF